MYRGFLFFIFDREGDYNPKAKLNFKTPNAQTIVKTFFFICGENSFPSVSVYLSVYLSTEYKFWGEVKVTIVSC